jgi:hypothetical protein
MKAVGANVPRYDGVAHVTAASRFVDDVRLPGMLWAKALRSPLASARILRLSTTVAEAMPGVHAVITHTDVPKNVVGHQEVWGIAADEPLLARTRGALCRPAHCRGGGRDRGAGPGRRPSHRGRLRGAPRLSRRAPGLDLRRASGGPGRQRLLLLPGPAAASDPQGRRGRRLRPGGCDRRGGLPPRRHRTGAGRAGLGHIGGGPRRSGDDLFDQPGPVLLDGDHRPAPVHAHGAPEVRRWHGGGRLRRQARHRHRARHRRAGHQGPPPGQVALDARRRNVVLVDPGRLAHRDRRRRDPGRLAPGPADADPARCRGVHAHFGLCLLQAHVPPGRRLFHTRLRLQTPSWSRPTTSPARRCGASGLPRPRSPSRPT